MSYLVNESIKIKYVEEGYLPNYPYYLISDKEMIKAFLREDDGYFAMNYPCDDENLIDAYQLLLTEITYHLNQYLADNKYNIPSWVYSYMIGDAVCDNSSQLDKHSLFTMLNLDNINDEFTPQIYESVYEVSQNWLRKLPADKLEHRPPTMFGEPHVIKSLKLQTAV